VPYATLRLHKATNQVTYTAPFSKPIVFDLPPQFRSKPIYAAAQVVAGLCFAAPSSAAADTASACECMRVWLSSAPLKWKRKDGRFQK
jgi:hypothetical protein